MKEHILKHAAIALVCGLLAGPAVKLAAQDLGSLGKQAQGLGSISSLSSLTQKLHLTPQQLQQVMPILQGEVPKLQAIASKTGLTGTQKLDQTRAVQKQSDSKLKGMLSPDQFQSLKSFRSLQLKDIAQGVVPQ
jgi:hypothetical protein